MKPELNIAMIEDSPAHCQQLQTTLNQWAKEKFVTLHTAVFTDCASCTLDKMLSFDVIFLDIELPDGSGLTLAQSLRNANYLGTIIILSAHEDYALQGYRVRALYYIVKPVTLREITFALSPVITQLMDDCYTISISKHETKQIKYSDIVAFRCIKSSHYISIDTITDVYRQRATINTLCDALPDYFLQTNRSTIMNLNHIQSISQKDITGSNDLIYPLSIEYADDVKKRWIRSSNPYIN